MPVDAVNDCLDDVAVHHSASVVDQLQLRPVVLIERIDLTQVFTTQLPAVNRNVESDKTLSDVQNSKPCHTHTTQLKPHKCQQCEKCYGSASLLKRHCTVMHSGVNCCELCGRCFSDPACLKDHTMRHSGEKSFTCHYCQKTFFSTNNLAYHSITTHGTKKIYDCTHCEELFETVRKLKQHMAAALGEFPHKCQHCDKSFRTLYSLRGHDVVHSTEKNYSCHICLKKFKHKDGLESHINTHNAQRPFSCTVCNRTYCSVVSLKYHQVRHSVGGKPHRCEQCGKCFVRLNELKKHMQLHTGEKPFSCDVCGKRFFNRHNASNHKQRIHSSERPCICMECGRSFKIRYDLLVHMNLHLGIRKFSCPLCGKKFSSSGNLSTHVDSHSGVKRHSCLTCGKMFYFPSQLRMHQSVHTGSRPFHCPTCGAHFRRKAGLRRHLKSQSHSRIKSYACKDCDQEFPDKKAMTFHRKQHHASFQCTICGKCLSTPNGLREHMKTHREKIYMCPDCDRRFVTSTDLRKHLKLHLEGFPFNCPYCSKGFVCTRNLLSHLRMQHRHSLKKQLQPHKCPQCGALFPSFVILAHHQHQVHAVGAEQYLCKYCDKTFSQQFELDSHACLHNIGVAVATRFDDVTVSPSNTIDPNEPIERSKNSFGCGKCGELFSTKIDVLRHSDFCSCVTEPAKVD